VEVVALRDETYYGNIMLQVDGAVHNIDSRPSDAINLAVRKGVPIFVARDVMEQAGLVPEEDLTELEAGSEGKEDQPVEEERLSVFEDYLDKLGPDQINQEEDENDEDDDE
jgi:hypothetical protein